MKHAFPCWDSDIKTITEVADAEAEFKEVAGPEAIEISLFAAIFARTRRLRDGEGVGTPERGKVATTPARGKWYSCCTIPL